MLKRERRTIRAMVEIYCRERHAGAEKLCADCAALLEYADYRLDKCPFQDKKPACGNCHIHCYKPEMRRRIRDVMRYSGPRLMRKHPILALLHVLDGFKKPPRKKRS